MYSCILVSFKCFHIFWFALDRVVFYLYMWIRISQHFWYCIHNGTNIRFTILNRIIVRYTRFQWHNRKSAYHFTAIHTYDGSHREATPYILNNECRGRRWCGWAGVWIWSFFSALKTLGSLRIRSVLRHQSRVNDTLLRNKKTVFCVDRARDCC